MPISMTDGAVSTGSPIDGCFTMKTNLVREGDNPFVVYKASLPNLFPPCVHLCFLGAGTAGLVV